MEYFPLAECILLADPDMTKISLAQNRSNCEFKVGFVILMLLIKDQNDNRQATKLAGYALATFPSR